MSDKTTTPISADNTEPSAVNPSTIGTSNGTNGNIGGITDNGGNDNFGGDDNGNDNGGNNGGNNGGGRPKPLDPPPAGFPGKK